MKKATALTLHTTSEGKRVSCSYIEIDQSGRIIGDNVRTDFILIDGLHDDQIEMFDGLFSYIQDRLNEINQ